MIQSGTQTATISFVSLGCPKNVVDAENMLGQLAERGYVLSADPAESDIIIVNTCSFIDAAREESKAHIREMAGYKKNGRCRALLVSGCLAQRYSDTLMQDMPEIDGLLGVSRIQDIDKTCRKLLARRNEEKKYANVADPDDLDQTYRVRMRFGMPHYAYLKISEGCNQKCAFCAIPGFRGILKSRPIDDLVRETEDLVAGGAREIILISQDSSSYGKDIYGQRRIADLARALTTIEDLEWLRILYHYPTSYPMDLIDEIAANEKIVNYIDIPLQHINDDVLLRMKRGIQRSKIENLLQHMRDRIPGVILRTTFLTGFPGETEGQFEELCEFIQDFHFDRLGCFAYSFEKNTKSAGMEGHLPETVKNQRRDRIMEIQQDIAYAANREKVGQTLRVLVDSHDPESGQYIARSAGDAPEIDNLVYIAANGTLLQPGEFYNVTVADSLGYDLTATLAK